MQVLALLSSRCLNRFMHATVAAARAFPAECRLPVWADFVIFDVGYPLFNGSGLQM